MSRRRVGLGRGAPLSFPLRVRGPRSSLLRNLEILGAAKYAFPVAGD